MATPNEQVLHRAAEVVARWFDEQLGPSSAIAAMSMLRAEPPALRAEVSRIATATVGALRRLTFALGTAVDAADSRERAALLVLAGAVERGELTGEQATAAGLRATGWRVDLPTAADLAARIAAIDDPDRRLAVAASLPDWLVPLFRAAFADEVEAVVRALGEPAPRTLRVNLLRVASREQLVERLAAEHVVVLPGLAATAVMAQGTADLFRTRAYSDGCFEQQDEASQLAVSAIAAPPGGKVLDLCAGSGGKTLAIAAALGNRGQVMAADVHERRLQALRQRLARAGAHNVQVVHLDGSVAADVRVEQFARHADRIFVDAPCSGTGSWRRRPEARWAIDAAAVAAMQQLQAQLLDRAAGWLRPRARLVYATCSLLPDENDRQIAALQQRWPRLATVRLVEILGGALGRQIADPTGTFLSLRPDLHGCDGFFAAVLRHADQRS